MVMAVVRGSCEGTLLHETRLLQVCPLVDKKVAHGGVSVARSEQQGRVAAVISLVEGSALFCFVLFVVCVV